MYRPSLAASVCKLAMAGEQAGFTVEQMIRLLNAGMTVETLLDIIERRLSDTVPQGCLSNWIMYLQGYVTAGASEFCWWWDRGDPESRATPPVMLLRV